jgi:hypothetical protein
LKLECRLMGAAPQGDIEKVGQIQNVLFPNE